MTTNYELVDALIDHEAVDVDELRRVLEDPGAREYLLDAHLLRCAMLSERQELLEGVAAPRRPRWARLVLPVAMAAGLAVAFAGGRVSGGGRTLRPSPDVQAAEAALRASEPATFPAPAATRIIQVEFAASGATTGGN